MPMSPRDGEILQRLMGIAEEPLWKPAEDGEKAASHRGEQDAASPSAPLAESNRGWDLGDGRWAGHNRAAPSDPVDIVAQRAPHKGRAVEGSVAQAVEPPPGFSQPLSVSGPRGAVDKRVQLYKTEICRTFEETGACRYGTKCQFAHDQSELRPTMRHPRYKTEICKTFWEQGTCPYGKRCCFIHNESVQSHGSARSFATTDGSLSERFTHNYSHPSMETVPILPQHGADSRVLSRFEKFSASPIFSLSENFGSRRREEAGDGEGMRLAAAGRPKGSGGAVHRVEHGGGGSQLGDDDLDEGDAWADSQEACMPLDVLRFMDD